MKTIKSVINNGTEITLKRTETQQGVLYILEFNGERVGTYTSTEIALERFDALMHTNGGTH